MTGDDHHHDGPHAHDHAGGAGARPHSHSPAHSHSHSHGHSGHSHAPASFGRAFLIGIVLNTGFVIAEAGYGWASGSMALVADAGHNLSDVLGLVVAWAAASLSARPPTPRYTYGLRASSILAALFNAVFLLVAVGAIAWEAVTRLLEPAPVAGLTVTIVAAVGIAINAATAALFASGAKGDLNIRGAYLHMAADAVVSAGVVVAGLLVMATGWTWIDPAVSLVIVAVIVHGTWGLLRESFTLSLAAVPPGVDEKAVRAALREWPQVADVHDVHIWAMSTTETALTAHLLMPGGHPGDAFYASVDEMLERRFGIGHVTLQIETDPATRCRYAPDAAL